MKKLNLKMEGIGEMLSKEKMKNVIGGYGDAACYNTCLNSGMSGCVNPPNDPNWCLNYITTYCANLCGF
ncbi:hypothetical protein EOD41_06415 [Mucilaginibacter limnophilus]|uniref:Uncharacterized protein n=1 Tax=Mucilaginibacter limnophilus TaxID=1932778 RepID=A0A3S2Y1Z3_9SPHI|nr:hypothetical protein [Mucilaginibacter limnophilus]RVU01596.1 hypothetical protein EOD41_06415 [Mucilaginibacter limnophilus]